jgi:hypothetical protein
MHQNWSNQALNQNYNIRCYRSPDIVRPLYKYCLEIRWCNVVHYCRNLIPYIHNPNHIYHDTVHRPESQDYSLLSRCLHRMMPNRHNSNERQE